MHTCATAACVSGPALGAPPSSAAEAEGQLEQFRRLFEQVAAWRQREAERQRLMDEALVEPDSSGGGAEGSESPADGTSTAGSSSSAASDEPAAAGPSAASDKPGVAGPNAVDGGPAGSAGAPVPIPVERPAADPFPGTPPRCYLDTLRCLPAPCPCSRASPLNNSLCPLPLLPAGAAAQHNAWPPFLHILPCLPCPPTPCRARG